MNTMKLEQIEIKELTNKLNRLEEKSSFIHSTYNLYLCLKEELRRNLKNRKALLNNKKVKENERYFLDLYRLYKMEKFREKHFTKKEAKWNKKYKKSKEKIKILQENIDDKLKLLKNNNNQNEAVNETKENKKAL